VGATLGGVRHRDEVVEMLGRVRDRDEVAAMLALSVEGSRRVMERLGFVYEMTAPYKKFADHVLYRRRAAG
jgi:hypothetical protein